MSRDRMQTLACAMLVAAVLCGMGIGNLTYSAARDIAGMNQTEKKILYAVAFTVGLAGVSIVLARFTELVMAVLQRSLSDVIPVGYLRYLDKVDVRIHHQGFVRVEGGSVIAAYPDAALILLGVSPKRLLPNTGESYIDGVPGICLQADAAQFVQEEGEPVVSSDELAQETHVEFPQFEGWSVFAVDTSSKHEVAVALRRIPEID